MQGDNPNIDASGLLAKHRQSIDLVGNLRRESNPLAFNVLHAMASDAFIKQCREAGTEPLRILARHWVKKFQDRKTKSDRSSAARSTIARAGASKRKPAPASRDLAKRGVSPLVKKVSRPTPLSKFKTNKLLSARELKGRGPGIKKRTQRPELGRQSVASVAAFAQPEIGRSTTSPLKRKIAEGESGSKRRK